MAALVQDKRLVVSLRQFFERIKMQRGIFGTFNATYKLTETYFYTLQNH